MAHELSPKGVQFYRDFTAQQQQIKQQKEEWQELNNRVGALFKQGQNILDEYGDSDEGINNTPGESSYRGIRVLAPIVELQIRDKTVSFRLLGFKDTLKTKPYKYLSIYADVDGYLSPLFRIDSHENLTTPLKEAGNDPEAIEAASGFLDSIQQSLSETHWPRSQIPQPQTRDIIRRLKTLVSRH